MNVEGAKPSHVDSAVKEIERAGSADLYFRRILKYGETRGWKYSSISEYPEEMRLAFEMAAHEQSERVAMEGELAQLESDWREAEEIAAIADNLFLPKSVTDFMERHRPNWRRILCQSVRPLYHSGSPRRKGYTSDRFVICQPATANPRQLRAKRATQQRGTWRVSQAGDSFTA